jgi:hypothetical protein
MAIAITVLYVALVFGLYVSNWEFQIQTSNSTLSIPSNSIESKMVRRESSVYSNYLYNGVSYVIQHFLLPILYIIFKALIT